MIRTNTITRNQIKGEVMTDQEIFDAVVTHARKQQARSVSHHGDCCYRGNNGLRCFAGCLIADEDYDPSMEGSNCMLLPPIIKLTQNTGLVRSLQTIHDKYGVEYWESRFKALAIANGLEYREMV